MAQPAESQNSWVKWIVNTLIALLAAGGGIVALMNYFKPSPQDNHPPAPTMPAPQNSLGSQNIPGNNNSVVNNIGLVTNNIKEVSKKPLELKTVIKTSEDVQKLSTFLKANVGSVVHLTLTFSSKKESGVSDFGWERWMNWKGGEDERIKQSGVIEITFDEAPPLEDGVVGAHFILSIDDKGHFYLERNGNDDGLGGEMRLDGAFTLNWVNEVGQGYEKAALTPAN